MEKRKFCDWDLNTGLLDGRCTQINGAMAAPRVSSLLFVIKFITES